MTPCGQSQSRCGTVADSHVGLPGLSPAAVVAPLSQFAGDECCCSFGLAVVSHLGLSSYRRGFTSLRTVRVGACGLVLPERCRCRRRHRGWLGLISSCVGGGGGGGHHRRLLVGAAIRLEKLEFGLQSLGRRGGGARSGGRSGSHCSTRSPRSSGFEQNQLQL